jgi:hypothetical protein
MSAQFAGNSAGDAGTVWVGCGGVGADWGDDYSIVLMRL